MPRCRPAPSTRDCARRPPQSAFWRHAWSSGAQEGYSNDLETHWRRDDVMSAMKPRCLSTLVLFSLLAWGSVTPVSAQLTAAKDGPIVYGHHHLTVTNVEVAKKFWVDALGGTVVKVGTSTAEAVRLPNVFIFFNQRQPTGGTKGS